MILFFTNNLISSFSSVDPNKETFPWLPKGFVSQSWKSLTSLTYITLQVPQNGPLRGPWGFLLPVKVCYKQTPNQRYAGLSFWMWEKNKCEKGEKGKARKNQQDINCFEANRHRLIENLEINDFRIHLSPNNNNHHKNKPKQNTKRVPNSQCPA